MLRITINSDSESTTCKLEGKLAGPWVPELEQSWRTELAGSRSIVVDLDQVSFVDAVGKALLARMHAQGAKLVTLQIKPGQTGMQLAGGTQLQAPRMSEFAGAFLWDKYQPTTRVDAAQHCLSAMTMIERDRLQLSK